MKTVWFIDDNCDHLESMLELYEECNSRGFESCVDAFQADGRPDMLVIDLSTCGLISMSHAMYAPICLLIGKYSNAQFVVCSALPVEYSIQVVKDVRREMPEADIFPINYDDNPLDYLE